MGRVGALAPPPAGPTRGAFRARAAVAQGALPACQIKQPLDIRSAWGRHSSLIVCQTPIRY